MRTGNLSLPGGFKLANSSNNYCDVATSTGSHCTVGQSQSYPGEYSCLRVNLVFARELSFYILTIYIPCFMIVLVSWFSFWLDYKAVSNNFMPFSCSNKIPLTIV